MSGNKRGILLYTNLYTTNLEGIKARYLKNNFDWVQAIDGYERLGKSTLAVKSCLFVDPSFDLSRVCFTPDQYMKAVENAKKGQAVLFDEAGTGLFSREAMTRGNIELNKMLMTIGAKNLFHCLLIPKFLRLDRNVAENRVMSWVHIYRRGVFSFYSRKRLSIVASTQNQFSQRPNFCARWPDRAKSEFDWKGYEKAKQKHLKEFFSDKSNIDKENKRVDNAITEVRANIKKFSKTWRGQTIIVESVVKHSFRLSRRDAEQVKNVLEMELNR